MFMAAFAIVMLFRTGMSPATLVAVMLACVMSTASIVFFGRWKG